MGNQTHKSMLEMSSGLSNTKCHANTSKQHWAILDALHNTYPHFWAISMNFPMKNVAWPVQPAHKKLQSHIDFHWLWAKPEITVIAFSVGYESPGNPGHAVAIVVDKKARTLEYFDSNVFRPTDVPTPLNVYAFWLALKAFTGFKETVLTTREEETQHGPFCMAYVTRFLTMRAKGLPFKEAVDQTLTNNISWLNDYLLEAKVKPKRKKRTRTARRRQPLRKRLESSPHI